MKRIINLLTLILALLSGLTACQKPNIPPPQEELLYNIECFHHKHPDSALQILDTLNVAMLSEKEKAQYCLLKAQAISMIDFDNAETDSLLEMATNYFSKHDEKYFEALAYYAQSRISGINQGSERQTIEPLLKALQCAEECRHLDSRLLRCTCNDTDEAFKIGQLKSQIQFALASYYASTGFVEESNHYAKLADQFYAEYDKIRPRIRTSFVLGTNYLELGNYDSCLMYFENGLRFAEAAHDDVERAYYYVVTNLYYMNRVDYEQYETEEERLQLLRKAVVTSRKGLEVLDGAPNSFSAVQFRAELNQSLCNGYYELQQYDSALYFGHQVEGLEDNDLLSAQTYKYMLLSYLALGNVENAQRYADLYFAKTWEFEFVGKEVAEVNDEYTKRIELQRLENEQQLKRMRLYLLLAAVVIVLLVTLFLFYRQQKEKELENLRLHEEKRQLQQHYDDKERLSSEALRQRMKTVYKEQNDRLDERLFNEFKAVYPNALNELQAAHPELTETEQSICLLSFFSFRVKEIAYILDLRENTVSKSRLSIKKKTGMDDPADIVRPFIG